MKIHGLQKLTLLDFPGRVACTVFLGGCDMRCPFCHNYDLATGAAPAVMEEDALFAFLEKRRGLLEGVAVTGGEPCLRPDLPKLLRGIKSMGYAVKLDTNGTHPDRLEAILDEGLADYVAMDIKNSPERYAMTAGLDELDLGPIRRSVDILRSGRTDYEFRTTVVEPLHRAENIEAIGAWLNGARRYALQMFTDRDSVPFGNLRAPAREDMQTYREIAQRYIGEVLIRGMD